MLKGSMTVVTVRRHGQVKGVVINGSQCSSVIDRGIGAIQICRMLCGFDSQAGRVPKPTLSLAGAGLVIDLGHWTYS
jgi:hypothetical protein